MDFSYTVDEMKFRERLNEFLDKEMTEEIARQNWEDLGVGREAREFSLKLAAYGFLGMSWPTEYGGKGLGPTYDFILLDELYHGRTNHPAPRQRRIEKGVLAPNHQRRN
ncbi:MAG: acyl-CoA dehydrogenase family protein [Desulfobacterales bacterium]|nr:acyl-CoA dehydrogenase family protein [Desulfobacterales bacterium]